MLLLSVVFKGFNKVGVRGIPDIQEALVGAGGTFCGGLLHCGEVLGFLQKIGVAEQ